MLGFTAYYHSDPYYAYEMTMSMIMIIFFIFAIIVSFMAYKEFKAIMFEMAGMNQGLIP